MSDVVDWQKWRGGRKWGDEIKNQYRFTDAGCTIVEMKLTQGKTTRFDAVDLPLVVPYIWCVTKGNTSNIWYAKHSVHNGDGTQSSLLLHVVLSGLTGDGNGEMVDHVDGDGLNNVKSNRRVGDGHVNMNNRALSKNNVTGYNGVSDDKKNRTIGVRYYRNGKRIQRYFGYGKKRTQEAAMNMAIALRAAVDEVNACTNGKRPKYEAENEATATNSTSIPSV